MPETWRDIPGYDEYQASTLGRVRSLKEPRRTRDLSGILRPSLAGGYLAQPVRVAGKDFTVKVHKLVALAFLGARPSKRHEADHKDGDQLNNRPDNLRWRPRGAHKARHSIQIRQHTLVGVRVTLKRWNAGEDDLRAIISEEGISVRQFRNALRGKTAKLLKSKRAIPARLGYHGKIDAKTEASILDRLAVGETGVKLAGHLGVSEATISLIKSGKLRSAKARRPSPKGTA